MRCCACVATATASPIRQCGAQRRAQTQHTTHTCKRPHCTGASSAAQALYECHAAHDRTHTYAHACSTQTHIPSGQSHRPVRCSCCRQHSCCCCCNSTCKLPTALRQQSQAANSTAAAAASCHQHCTHTGTRDEYRKEDKECIKIV